MLYCRAYPVKKMIPLDAIASAEPCVGRDFAACPLFRDVLTGMQAQAQPLAVGTRPGAAAGEVLP